MVVLYYQCQNCKEVFAVDPQKRADINLVPDFEKKVFDENEILPLGNQINLIHSCDNHTFGPSYFIYGKKVIEPGV